MTRSGWDRGEEGKEEEEKRVERRSDTGVMLSHLIKLASRKVVKGKKSRKGRCEDVCGSGGRRLADSTRRPLLSNR